jgi:FMN-dependent NADH-azoreductase
MILLNGQISLETHQNDHAITCNGGFLKNYSKMPFDMVENFLFHLFKSVG